MSSIINTRIQKQKRKELIWQCKKESAEHEQYKEIFCIWVCVGGLRTSNRHQKNFEHLKLIPSSQTEALQSYTE